MITFTLTNREVIYSIVPENVLHLIHVPQMINMTQQLYGELCGQIINEFAFHGRATFETTVSPLLTNNSRENVSLKDSVVV